MSIMFGLILLALVSLYYDTYRSTGGIDTSNVRTDELHYFIESSKKDVSRAMTISGRRAAIYLIDNVVSTGAPLSDPEQSLEELMINSTLTIGPVTQNVSYMQNHTLSKWLADVKNGGEKQYFDVNLSVSSLDIYAYDAWNFLEIMTLSFNVSDKKGGGRESCRYENTDVKISSLVPIAGLEDDLYALKTTNKIRRFFLESNSTKVYELVGSAAKGNGTGGGRICDLSTSGDPSASLASYNTTYPELVNYTVFVMNISDYSTLLSGAKTILNMSAGVINYNDIPLDSIGFPYVAGLSALNASNSSFVALKNDEQHNVVRLLINDDISKNTYYASGNGSSFFDRLEGRLNVTQKYLNQSLYSRGLLNSGTYTPIGLESLVNVTDFYKYELYSLGILPNYTSQSSVDYQYFQNASGLWVYGTPEWLRLDPKHLEKYNLTELSADASLIFSYGFDETNGTIVYDRSRNANNGRVLGNAGRTPGKAGGAIGFDGVDDRINATPKSGQQITENLTISLWVNPASTQKPHADLVSKHGNGGYALEQSGAPNANSFGLIWDPAGDGSYTGTYVVTNLSAGGWQHFAVVKSGTQILQYLNGTLRTTGAGSSSLISANNLSITIGDRTGGSGRQFNGTIDEVKIWNRALPAEEIFYEYEKSR